jgi:hypothetical protein
MKAIALASVSALVFLSACTTTLDGDAQAKAGKVYDTICTAEPPVYAVTYTLGEGQGWKQSTLTKLEQAHAVVTRLCASRPVDLVSGLVTLTKAYQDVLAIKASSET